MKLKVNAYHRLKPVVGVICPGLGLILLAALLLVIGLLLRIDSPGPAIFWKAHRIL